MGSLLDRATPGLPVRAKYLVEKEKGLDPDVVRAGIQTGRIVLLDAEDYEALYRRGLIDKEFILKIMPRDPGIIKELCNRRILDEEDVRRLKEEILKELERSS